jgi:radical SAM protein (TIGR01212 family)
MNTESVTGFPWGHSRPYNDLGGYLKGRFQRKIQKLSLDAGFTCPNRDGTKGTGGCTFCNNSTFSPAYCSPALTVSDQLARGIGFFAEKYPEMGYLAYFQAYTNTYGDIERLKELYTEALEYPGICGLVVGTRPDCITDELLDYFSFLAESTYLSIEYGIESTLNRTLDRINRGHDFQTSAAAINRTASKGIHTGGHVILGLPGESVEDMLSHALALNRLPINMIKIHQLQVIRGTVMEQEFLRKPDDFVQFTAESYIDLVIRFLEILNPAIVVERFANSSPPEMIAGIRWGLRNYEIVARIEKEMVLRNTWQGRLFNA